MKHSVENGIRKLPSSAAYDRAETAKRLVSIGLDKDSQMTLRWSKVPLSSVTGLV